LHANTTSVRRFALAEVELSLDAILSRAKASFGLSVDKFQLCYTDDEGDKIKIGTNEEVIEALRLSRVKKDILRLFLVPIGVAPVAAELNKVSPSRKPNPNLALVPIVTGAVTLTVILLSVLFFTAPSSSNRESQQYYDQKANQPSFGPSPPMCTHYLHTIYTDPYFDSHKGDAILFRDWRNQLKQAKVMKCGDEYYFFVDGRHSQTLEYKRWNGEAWTATIRPGVKFHHVKANSGGRTSFTGRAFEVTNSAGQSWVSAVTTQHETEASGLRLRLPLQEQTYQPQQQPQQQIQEPRQHAFWIYTLLAWTLFSLATALITYRFTVSTRRRECRNGFD